jgi:vacuolar-type H+-ATPase subunit I/STV1
VLHVEELAVNQLRETFHHWIHTLQFPVTNGELGDPLDHVPALTLRQQEECQDQQIVQRARDIFSDLEPDLQERVKAARQELTRRLQEQLAVDGQAAREQEEQRYRSRQGEVSTLIVENTLAKLEREIGQLKSDRAQGRLFESQAVFDELERSIEAKQQELERRRVHYEEVREQLARERERILTRLIPKRYALEGEAHVFPVAVEIRFPRKKR